MKKTSVLTGFTLKGYLQKEDDPKHIYDVPTFREIKICNYE